MDSDPNGWPTAADGLPSKPDDPRWAEIYGEREPLSGPAPSKNDVEPLPESFGRNLTTIEEARRWLTNPHNWHRSSLFILKWNGLLCTVDQTHGERLWREPWDSDLPVTVLISQKQFRTRPEGPAHEAALSSEE